MIPAPLFDHHATVWRHRERTGTQLREVTRQWSPVKNSRRIGLILSVTRERREDTGAGERTTGEYAGLCNTYVDVEEGDVLEVYAGRMAPIQLRVDQHDAEGGMNAELVLVPYTGKLAS